MLRSLVAGLELAFTGARAHTARTILSCAGIVVGIGAVILVVTVGDVGQRLARAYSEANAGIPATYRVDIFENSRIDDFAAFERDLRRAGGAAVSLLSEASGVRVRAGDTVVERVEVLTVDAELADIRRFDVVSGRWFTEADRASLAPILVVNESLAREIESGERPEVGVDGWRDARIVGVVADSALERGERSAYLLRAPTSAELAFPGGDPGAADGLSYRVRVAPEGADARAYQRRLLTAARQWATAEPPGSASGEARSAGLRVYRQDPARQIETVLLAASVVLLGVAAVTLATGMFGVLNVGLMTVRERRRELATYRALGASSATLFIAVLAEAVVVSVVAGIIALALCVSLVAAVGAAVAEVLPSGVAVYVPPDAIVAGMVSAATTGLLAGVIPAWRALRTSIVAGLRE